MNDLILVVEDEPKLAQLMSDYLKQSEFRSHVIHNGLEVVPWVKENQPQLVLLDLMLPGKDGIEICREIRAFSDIPIIMTTARVDEVDRLLGLELGADDYVCKPFSYREVVARVKVILRRVSRDKTESIYENGFSFDEEKMLVRFHDKSLDLTAVEYRLLSTLVKEPGRIFNRDQLMRQIYDEYRVVSDRTIDSHVKKLRKKLKDVADGNELIHSVYSVGYKYEA